MRSSEPTRFGTSLLVEGSVHVLELRGELDMASGPKLEAEMRDLLPRVADRLVMDLTALDHIDSRGLSALLTSRELAQKAGVTVDFVCPHGKVWHVFERMSLLDVLPVHASRDLAYGSAAQGSRSGSA